MASVVSFSADEIQFIKDQLQLPHLEIVVQKNWGSQSPSHREEIHGELKKRMATAYPFSDSSISHCPTLGGFIFAKYDSEHVLQVGFDVEVDERVSEQVAKRVCKTEEEYLKAPSPVSLWAAKEAAFKSLKGAKQPLVVPEIELDHWKVISSHIETVAVKDCRTFESSRMHGVLIKKSGYTFAFFASIS